MPRLTVERRRDVDPIAETNRVIIRALRLSLHGIVLIGIVFVAYLVATMVISAHDNRRIDEIEKRVRKLEPAEHP